MILFLVVGRVAEITRQACGQMPSKTARAGISTKHVAGKALQAGIGGDAVNCFLFTVELLL